MSVNNQTGSTSGPSTTAPDTTSQPKPVEQLGSLEEDDEFEEFPVEDWDESATTLAVLTKQAQQNTSSSTGVGSSAGDVGAQLWEDNWDDDDKEPPFVQQLRAELKSQSDADAMKL